MDPKWLEWVKKLQGIAQSGLHYTENHFDRDRFEQLNDLAAEILKEYSTLDATKSDIVDMFSKQEGYATPKVDVRGAVIRDKKILLVKEAVDCKWTMPGGWADVATTPSVNVEREVWEEAGFEVKTTKLIGVFDRSTIPNVRPYPFHIYKLIFLCEILSGEPTPSDETLAVDFFDKDNLPELSMGRTTPDYIFKAFAHYQDPTLPVEFD